MAQSTEIFNEEVSKIKKIIPDTISDLKFKHLSTTSREVEAEFNQTKQSFEEFKQRLFNKSVNLNIKSI